MKKTFSPQVSAITAIVLLLLLALGIGLAIHARSAQTGRETGQTRYLKLGHGLPTDKIRFFRNKICWLHPG